MPIGDGHSASVSIRLKASIAWDQLDGADGGGGGADGLIYYAADEEDAEDPSVGELPVVSTTPSPGVVC